LSAIFPNAGLRVDGDEELSRRGREHGVADDDRIALNIVAAIARMVNPGDLKIGDVLAIDLIQSGVARPAVVTMGTMPGEESFAVRTAIGRRLNSSGLAAGMIW